MISKYRGRDVHQALSARRLHGHVERRGDLIADEQFGTQDEGASLRDPLPYPAGQLIGVAGREEFRHGDQVQGARDVLFLLGAGQPGAPLHGAALPEASTG